MSANKETGIGDELLSLSLGSRPPPGRGRHVASNWKLSRETAVQSYYPVVYTCQASRFDIPYLYGFVVYALRSKEAGANSIMDSLEKRSMISYDKHRDDTAAERGPLREGYGSKTKEQVSPLQARDAQTSRLI